MRCADCGRTAEELPCRMGIAWACMECQWWTGMGVAEWPMHVLARLGVMEARQKMQEEQDGD